MKKNTLIVTSSWDDGVATDLKLGLLLQKYKVKGTFYVSRLATDDLLKPEDIVSLGKDFEIGSHTMNHPVLTGIPLYEAKTEIKSSKEYLQQLLGHPVDMFCYPDGRYNLAVKQIVKESGFTGARTCIPGGFDPPDDNFEWHMTFLTSNGSPLMALKIFLNACLLNPAALFDWEARGKSLFDKALHRGGVYHIYGHSLELETNNEWPKLERLLAYVSGKENVLYLTNSEVLEYFRNNRSR